MIKDGPALKTNWKLQEAKNRALIISAALDRAIADEEFWTSKLENANDSASLEETKRILEKKLEEVKELKVMSVESKAAIKLIEADENQWAND